MTVKNNQIFHIGGILLVATLSILPIWLNGIPPSPDAFQHFQFAASVYQAILTGEIFPNWAHTENAGYGGIGLRFYPPAAYYVLAFGKILTGNWYDAVCLALVFWMFAGGLGVYLWASEYFSPRAALFAGCLYIFAPYKIMQIYGIFLYADFAAGAILPFCFLFITRIFRQDKFADVFYLAIFLAILIFTHLPSTVIGGLCFAIYAVALFNRQNFSSAAAKLGAAVLLGLCASAFQWAKVVTEMKFLNHSSDAFFSAIYDFRQNFVFSFPYLWREDERGLMFSDLATLMIFLFSIPLAVIFFKYAASEKRKELRGVLILAIFTLFMATPLSLPIWENFGLLQKVQFPWRWLSLVSLSFLIFAAAGFEDFLKLAKQKSFRPFTLLIIGGCLIGFAFTFGQIMRQATYVPRTEFLKNNADLKNLSNLVCWFPVWAKAEAQQIREKVQAGNRSVEIMAWSPHEKVFRISSGEVVKARLAVYYYPLWQAEINGVSTQLAPASDGAISLKIPTEESLVKVHFVESSVVKIAVRLTLLSWIFLFIATVYVNFRQKNNLSSEN